MYRLLIFCAFLVWSSSARVLIDSHSNGRIVGGIDTSIDKFPFLVSVKFFDVHRCGGSIYTFNVVLIAANCVLGLSKDYLTITAGITNLNEQGIEREVKDVIIHEEYSAWLNANDIALIILKKSFVYTKMTQAIILASDGEEIPAGTRGSIAGWSSPDNGEEVQADLHYKDVYTFSKKECAERYNPYYDITDDMICAGPAVGKGGVCYGDFGGPLVIGGRLFGITSFSINCGDRLYPPVFLKISKFRSWISEQVEKLELQ